MSDTVPPGPRRDELRALAALFLRLGTTAFGGPAAHIAMMEDEVVRRRRWLTRDEFLDLLGAANLIPGPNSTELAIHIGHRRAGFPGLLTAGACFILPAALIVSAIGWGYRTYGALPAADSVLYGVKPVVVAVVLQAIVALARSALKTKLLWVVALLGIAATALGVNELLVLAVAGLAVVLWRLAVHARASGAATSALAFPSFRAALGATAVTATTTAASTVELSRLFLFFVKVGSVLYGSGYVLLAFLRADLVEHWHWLTEAQLLDAIAVGQITPGPVFTTATFIGWILGGPKGAALGTLGIFLPAFVFVALSGPLVPRLRRSRIAGAFLDGVNAASLALMAVVTAQLARSAVFDLTTVVLALLSAVALIRFRINSSWLVLAGALAGVLRQLL